jgi:hypothetical protein
MVPFEVAPPFSINGSRKRSRLSSLQQIAKRREAALAAAEQIADDLHPFQQNVVDDVEGGRLRARSQLPSKPIFSPSIM